MKQKNVLLGPKVGWTHVPNILRHVKPDQWDIAMADCKYKQPLVKHWLPN